MRNWETRVATIAIDIRITKLIGDWTSVTIGAKIVAIFDIITQIPIAVEVRIVGYTRIMPK